MCSAKFFEDFIYTLQIATAWMGALRIGEHTIPNLRTTSSNHRTTVSWTPSKLRFQKWREVQELNSIDDTLILTKTPDDNAQIVRNIRRLFKMLLSTQSTILEVD